MAASFTLHELQAKPLPSPTQFEGVRLTFFNKENGRCFLKISYAEAVAQKRSIGFLKMNLAFLKIGTLNLEMDTAHMNVAKVTELFQEVSSARGVRYAVAEPISLDIKTQNGVISIQGDKGKFSANSTLRIWGGTTLSNGREKKTFNAINFSIETEKNRMLLSSENGDLNLSIPLGEGERNFKVVPTSSRKENKE